MMLCIEYFTCSCIGACLCDNVSQPFLCGVKERQRESVCGKGRGVGRGRETYTIVSKQLYNHFVMIVYNAYLHFYQH